MPERDPKVSSRPRAGMLSNTVNKKPLQEGSFCLVNERSQNVTMRVGVAASTDYTRCRQPGERERMTVKFLPSAMLEVVVKEPLGNEAEF